MSSPIILTGSCFCRSIQYTLQLTSKDDARTSLCHCNNCKKAFGGAFGGAFGVTVKVTKEALRYEGTGEEDVVVHNGDNGSGSNVIREFCPQCGSYICEDGEQVKDKFRYIALGSLDDPEQLPPKGEFFCKQRASWMPEIPGVFHKQEIKE